MLLPQLSITGVARDRWSGSVCLTSAHNIWPLGYSAAQLINNGTRSHVFPLTTASKKNASVSCRLDQCNNEAILLIITHFNEECTLHHVDAEMWS